MSNHQKRLSAPDSWPVERKTAKFTVKAEGPHGDDGVPLVVLLRDVLGYVDSTKEASYAVNTDGVLVNGESPHDPERPIGMFDILAFPARSEYYRVFPDEGGRLGLTPIDEDAAGSKLGKVVDKTVVDGGKTQLNLHDGANLLVDGHEFATGDSVVVDNDDNTIVAHFPYEEGALVTAVDGRHAGEIGRLASIEVTPGSSSNTVRVDVDDGEFETVEEYVVVIDENFVGGEPVPGEAEEAETEGDEAEPETEESDVEDAEAESPETEAAETEAAEPAEVEDEEADVEEPDAEEPEVEAEAQETEESDAEESDAEEPEAETEDDDVEADDDQTEEVEADDDQTEEAAETAADASEADEAASEDADEGGDD